MSRRSDDRPFLEPFAGLLAESHGAIREFEVGPGPLTIDDGLRLAEPLHGRGRATRTNRGLLVEVEAQTALEELCSRCLDPVRTPLVFVFQEEVLPSIDLASGAAMEPDLEPEVVRLDDHHRLDLEPLLREAISLAEPIAPLCRRDCPGLCVTCGARLADDPGHHHDDADIDPRLAVLKGLTVDADAENG
ncbi:MAG: DUF177 domain-containing protein [Chloroflexi bacterium]|nr:DUF177 domain-containing protein [Chloroflexota bacterium]